MRKGQSSIEFLAVTGIGLLLIAGVTTVYLNYSKGNEDRAALQQVSTVGQTILQEAQGVYAFGSNSWTTLQVSLPGGVREIYVVENNTIVFDVATSVGMVSQPVFSSIPITGVRTVGTRSYVNNGSVSIHGGTALFRITSQGDNVTIQAIS